MPLIPTNNAEGLNASGISQISTSEKPKIFVSMQVDELGLDPYEFRIYGHIARRRNCFASLSKISTTCCMSVRRTQYALKVLEVAGLVRKTKGKGRTNTFVLTPFSKWVGMLGKKELENIRKKLKSGEKMEPLSTTPSPSDSETGISESDVPF